MGYGITGLWDFNSLQKRAVLYLATVRSHCPSGYRGGLWEQEIPTDGQGPVGLNAELRKHRSFKRKLWEQEIPARKPQIF